MRDLYEAPAVTELGDLAEITRGTSPTLLDTDVVTTGSV